MHSKTRFKAFHPKTNNNSFSFRCIRYIANSLQCSLQVLDEIIGLGPAVGFRKEHVVFDQRIGNDQMRLSLLAVFKAPVGQIIVVGIGIVQESPLFDGQPTGVHAGLAVVQSGRVFPKERLVDFHGPIDVLLFDLLGNVRIIPPAVSVAGNLPVALLLDGTDNLHVAFQCHADAPHSDGDLAAGENAMESPEATSRPVVVHAFHVQIALVGCRLLINCFADR